MPGAVFVPAALNDLSVDVSLGTPARGAVMYRGASKWNALAAGNAGEALLSGGAGADPAWGSPAANLSPAVILAPAAPGRNTITPANDSTEALILRPFSAGSGVNILDVKDAGGNDLLQVFPPGTGLNVSIQADGNDITPLYVAGDFNQSFPVIVAASSFGQYLGTIGAAGSYNIWGAVTDGSNQQQMQLSGAWLDNTTATRKGRLILSALDFNGTREVLRGEADGTAPRIGFLGASAIVRPSSTTDLRAALINLGLYTTGGATPLDLNGGTLTAPRVTTTLVDIKTTGEIALSGSPGTAGHVLTSGGAGASVTWQAAGGAGATTLDGLTDVNLPAASQGDILYRNAAEWVRLVAGSSGDVLTTGGAGANPAWAPAGGSLTGAVILAPAASTRNVIQPTGDAVKALILKGFSGTHSANFLEVQTSAADAVLQFTAPSSSTHALIVGGTYPSFGTVRVRCSPTIPALVMDDINSGFQANIRPYTGNTVFFSTGITSTTPAQLICAGLVSSIEASNTLFSSGQYSAIIKTSTGSLSGVLASHRYVRNVEGAGVPLAGFGGEFQMQLESSTTEDRDAASIDWLWATATDATRKARVVHHVWDTAAREGFRLEADGSNPMIGFLGANAVVRQTLSAAATDPATTQTLANDLRTALINLGLAA